jgi:hypothetical protein
MMWEKTYGKILQCCKDNGASNIFGKCFMKLINTMFGYDHLILRMVVVVSPWHTMHHVMAKWLPFMLTTIKVDDNLDLRHNTFLTTILVFTIRSLTPC